MRGLSPRPTRSSPARVAAKPATVVKNACQVAIWSAKLIPLRPLPHHDGEFRRRCWGAVTSRPSPPALPGRTAWCSYGRTDPRLRWPAYGSPRSVLAWSPSPGSAGRIIPVPRYCNEIGRAAHLSIWSYAGSCRRGVRPPPCHAPRKRPQVEAPGRTHSQPSEVGKLTAQGVPSCAVVPEQ
jgi:hypothetical protein